MYYVLYYAYVMSLFLRGHNGDLADISIPCDIAFVFVHVHYFGVRAHEGVRRELFPRTSASLYISAFP